MNYRQFHCFLIQSFLNSIKSISYIFVDTYNNFLILPKSQLNYFMNIFLILDIIYMPHHIFHFFQIVELS